MFRGIAPAGRLATGLLLSLALSGCESLNWAGPQDFLEQRAIAAPSGDEVTVCRAYNCKVKTRMPLSQAEVASLGKGFKSVGSPAEERAAIAKAVARLERIAGAKLGTAGDKGLLYPAGIGDPGQQDCVDEAATTTSYLMFLESKGLLKHHRTSAPSIRGFLIDGRWQHYSAVVTETGGEDYVIDSWPRDNGEEPVVQKLRVWMTSYDSGAETPSATQ